QRLVALDQLVLEDAEYGAGPVIRRGGDLDRVVALPLDGGPGALEVEPGGDLARGLAERVVDLLAVDLADDVERGVGHECGLRWFLGRARAALLFRVVADRPTWVRLTPGRDGRNTPLAGCPSGQRELTVNQPATPTVVRIHYLPRTPRRPVTCEDADHGPS